MKRISIVQAIIFVIAGLAILVAVFMFAFYRGGPKGNNLSNVVIWGVIPRETMDELFRVENANQKDNPYGHIEYVEKDPETFDEEFVTALAEGRGPDLVLLRENQMIENINRLTIIPYESFDLRMYQETFVEEANLLAVNNGYAGIPFYIDPLVMYYNRDILNSNGIARPPQTWTEILSIAPELTLSDSSFNISKSAIALGAFDNINNAKEILWTLIMQAGNTVIQIDDDKNAEPNSFKSILSDKLNYSTPPAQSAVNFFTQFSNPSTTIYSWNRSLPTAQDFFVAGNSAFYLGFASELPLLRIKNPNLNFDVVEIPQAKDSTKKTTYGKMYFIGIARGAGDLASSFNTSIILSNRSTQERLAGITGLPSVRRDLLSIENSGNSFDPIFKKSALFSYGVLEPGASDTNSILERMIQAITSGELEVSNSVNRANAQINNLLGN